MSKPLWVSHLLEHRSAYAAFIDDIDEQLEKHSRKCAEHLATGRAAEAQEEALYYKALKWLKNRVQLYEREEADRVAVSQKRGGS